MRFSILTFLSFLLFSHSAYSGDVTSSKDQHRTISLSLQRAQESDSGCKVILGAYNLGRELGELKVEFESTDIELNQKTITFSFRQIKTDRAASSTQVIPNTNCWRVLDFKITQVSGCNAANCNEKTKMDLGGPLPISSHSQEIQFHGNPVESN